MPFTPALFLFFIPAVTAAYPGFGQSPIDSLLLQAETADTAGLRALEKATLLLVQAQQDSAKAEQYIAQGLQLARHLKDRRAELEIKLNRALLYYYFEDFDAGWPIAREAEQQANRQALLPVKVRALKMQGLFAERTDPQQAWSYYEEALKVARQWSDKAPQISVLYEMGCYHYVRYRYDEAIGYFEQCRKWQVQSGTENRINCLQMQGNAYSFSGNYAKALSVYRECLQMARASGNQKDLATSLMKTGDVYYYQGNDTAAIAAYEEAMPLFLARKDDHRVSELLGSLGILYSAQGNYPRAARLFRRAIALSQARPKAGTTAHQYANAGFNYLRMGKTDSGMYYTQEAINRYQHRRDTASVMWVYKERGNTFGVAYDFPNALESYFRALSTAEQMRDTLGMAEVYNSMADIYRYQDDKSSSAVYRKKALRLFELTGNTWYLADTQLKMAGELHEEGACDKALEYAFYAAKTFRQLGAYCALGKSYYTIGSSYIRLHRADSALNYLRPAKVQAEKCSDTRSLARILRSMGQAHELLQEEVAAIRAYEEGLAIALNNDDKAALADIAERLHPLYERRGKLDKAYKTVKMYQAGKEALYNEDNTRTLIRKEMEYAHEKALQAQALLREQQEAALEKQQWITYGAAGALLAILGIMLALYRNYRNKYQANRLLTAQKEEITRQKAALEALDHTKSRFFANISHELRTPLTLMSSPLQQLLQDGNGDMPPSDRATLQLMERNTRQLTGLVNDILDLSKLESDKMVLHNEHLLIRPFVNRVASGFDSLACHQGVGFAMHFPVAPEAAVFLDAGKLEKILNNLLSNAIKHTPAGGSVVLNARLQGEDFLLEVTDTGSGILPEDMPYIFERFYQGTRPDMPAQGGTGIGLALVREFVTMMGGEIAVSSAEGEGSTFSVKLPGRVTKDTANIKAAEAGERGAPEAITPDHGQGNEPGGEPAGRVLIVEDHPDMQAFVRSLLVHQYRTEVAANGREALKILEKTPADLIVSDVMMPEMDGYSLLQQVKDSEKYGDIPVIMLTALSSEENKLKALTIGVDDYLCKPFSPGELLARVHNLLVRYRVREQVRREEPAEVEAAAYGADAATEPARKMRSEEKAWLESVATLFRENLEDSDLQLADYAARFHLSLRQFQRNIRRLTGLTLTEYQREIALQQARTLLEQKAYGNVSAVASSVGINHTTRFSKLYEARFGKKPAEYL